MIASEQQKQQQLQKDQQAELEYITQVFSQDLMNVTAVLAETQSVFKVFAKDKNHPMIPIHYNRCSTLLSLSNGIHKDTVETVDDALKKDLLYQRSLYRSIFDKFKEQQIKDKEVLNLAQIHSENTVNQQKPYFCEYVRKPTNQQAQFNNEVVQKVFEAIALIDQQREEILNENRKADVMDEGLVFNKAKSRADIGLLKCFANFYLEQVNQFVDNLKEDQQLIIKQYFEGEFSQKLQEIHIQELNKAVWASEDLIFLFHKDVGCKLDILGYFQLFCMRLALEPKPEQNFFEKVTYFLKQIIYENLQNEIDSFNQKYQTFMNVQQQPLINLEQIGKMEEENNNNDQEPNQPLNIQPKGVEMQVEASYKNNNQIQHNDQVLNDQFNNKTEFQELGVKQFEQNGPIQK